MIGLVTRLLTNQGSHTPSRSYAQDQQKAQSRNPTPGCALAPSLEHGY
jgi:hypothetical protein